MVDKIITLEHPLHHNQTPKTNTIPLKATVFFQHVALCWICKKCVKYVSNYVHLESHRIVLDCWKKKMLPKKLHTHSPSLVITPCCSRLGSVFPSRSSKIYPPNTFSFFQIITWQVFHNKKLCTYFLHIKIQTLLDPSSHHRVILEQMAFIQMATFRDHCHTHKCLKIKCYKTQNYKIVFS